MSVRDIEDIVKEEKTEEFEWFTDPIKLTIQHLFSKELSETNYRSLKPNEAKGVILAKFQKEGLLTEGHKAFKKATRLMKIVSSKTTVRSIILALGDHLID